MKFFWICLVTYKQQTISFFSCSLLKKKARERLMSAACKIFCFLTDCGMLWEQSATHTTLLNRTSPDKIEEFVHNKIPIQTWSFIWYRDDKLEINYHKYNKFLDACQKNVAHNHPPPISYLQVMRFMRLHSGCLFVSLEGIHYKLGYFDECKHESQIDYGLPQTLVQLFVIQNDGSVMVPFHLFDEVFDFNEAIFPKHHPNRCHASWKLLKYVNAMSTNVSPTKWQRSHSLWEDYIYIEDYSTYSDDIVLANGYVIPRSKIDDTHAKAIKEMFSQVSQSLSVQVKEKKHGLFVIENCWHLYRQLWQHHNPAQENHP